MTTHEKLQEISKVIDTLPWSVHSDPDIRGILRQLIKVLTDDSEVARLKESVESLKHDVRWMKKDIRP